MIHWSRQHDLPANPSSDAYVQKQAAQAQSSTQRRRTSGLKLFVHNSLSKHEKKPVSHQEWEAEYLKNLRSNRPARPTGSRPLPTVAKEQHFRAASALSFHDHEPSHPDMALNAEPIQRAASALSHRRIQSEAPFAFQHDRSQGHSLIQPSSDLPDAPAAHDSTVNANLPELNYRENGLRWIERQEARSLRQALEDMDLKQESRIHAAAQKEASELVRRHTEEANATDEAIFQRNYKGHLEKGAHQRSASQGWFQAPNKWNEIHAIKQRSTSGNSASSEEYAPQGEASRAKSDIRPDTANSRPMSRDPNHVTTHVKWDAPEKKAYTELAFPKPSRKSGHRKSSGRKPSNHSGPFINPEDKIYEEPSLPNGLAANIKQRRETMQALSTRSWNRSGNERSLFHLFRSSQKGGHGEEGLTGSNGTFRGPRTQSFNPSYVKNSASITHPQPFEQEKEDPIEDSVVLTEPIEVRSEDIRAATTMYRKDRSSKLPMPSAVSDKPGRHIVSFDKDWKDPDPRPVSRRNAVDWSGSTSGRRWIDGITSAVDAAQAPKGSRNDMPQISIALHDEEDKAGPNVPTIAVSTEESTSTNTSRRTKRNPLSRGAAPSSNSSQYSSVPHYSVAGQRATAQCAACGLPISGRIVSAASCRFHPQCFNCYHCAEALECVAFYPEPDNKREERLARIHERQYGEELPQIRGQTTEDGDESLRFYCHLDFHELFSPRCRSCKTPIEGEVVLACGGTWHVGHFFCAECGDPFDQQTPFVERDGYAWCVSCHAGKFSGKCRGCRRPIVDQVISALGAEWHEACFVCAECGSTFGDGKFFTREDESQPVCVRCEERRLKA